MTTPESHLGSLTGLLDVESHQLRNSIPIDVRNDSLALIKQIRHGNTLPLSPGWYEVSAVLNDGQRHSEIVQVRAGVTETIQLHPDLDRILPKSTITPPGVNPGGLSDSSPTGGSIPLSPSNPVHLLRSEECTIIDRTPAMWRFGPTPNSPQSMPTACFRYGNAEISVSLPVNPRGSGTESESVVTFSSHKDRLDVRAGFHSARIVSTAILNMVESGQLTHATLAAEQTAEDMLCEKYSDPVGAALGALIMFRAGSLSQRKAWLKNLTRDFDWLPEGKILFAALPHELPCEERADLLLRACKQRPMFTESYSILFETLRGWASDHRRGEIRDAVDAMARTLSDVDWNAFTFTVRKP